MVGTAIQDQGVGTITTTGGAETTPVRLKTGTQPTETDALTIIAQLADTLDTSLPQIVTSLTPQRDGGSI